MEGISGVPGRARPILSPRMVCPDAKRPGGRGASCIGLAGASPVAVIAGEPRSRLQPWGEIPTAERSVESPTRERGHDRTRVRGAKLWAQRERTLQPRESSPRKGGVGRAGHVAAKATDCIRSSGGMQDAPGVWRRARSDSPIRNRRGPTRRLTSSKDRAYKPKAKWRGVGRESEGRIVPSMVGESRAEGRGPALVVLSRVGPDEGMP